jgi:predicted RNase H-like nuclease (RuvC/YqgF family)
MLDSARAQDPDGRRLAIEIAQNMERDRNEHYNVLKCNAENNAKTIAALTAENVAFREMCEERNILKNERVVTALTEENRALRARLEQVKRQNERLREDLQVYRSACVSNHPLTGEPSSAAKRPRADSPDGSGAKP